MLSFKLIQWLYREFGLDSVYQTGPDTWFVMLARTCRMFAFGAISLILALFMSSLHFSDLWIGFFMTMTLVGDVILSLLAALVADRVGRRRILLLGGALMALSGTVFVFFENYWILLMGAVVGVISATGGDFGPFRSVEESTISHLTTPATRTDVLSWYVTTSTLGSALGNEAAGHIASFLKRLQGSKRDITNVYHAMFWIYVAMGVLSMILACLMSRKCESTEVQVKPDTERPRETEPLLNPGTAGEDTHEQNDSDPIQTPSANLQQPSRPQSWLGRLWLKSKIAEISQESLSVVIKLWILLTIDSLADGMVSYALTNYYLVRKFNLTESYLGDIMSICFLLMVISTAFAGPLARRLGLINTMVFTHLPSSLAVLLLPVPQNVGLTIALLFIRTGLNSMDQGPRAAFIAAVVKSGERTAVMGITAMLRTLGSTIGPSLTGFLADTDKFWIAFVVAGALRVAYDLGLFYLFVDLKINAPEQAKDPATNDQI
ncbi:MFS transporter, putative [Trichophyton verrucosum HKI 0517]|uniref:MFS transporter, putative n=1 Tax=Trichophyton verrucosum (strain HKI 0517) TaxID=663202 RepID=D4D5F6_TRIVH|nr:MFS transporter, putative [Trichophyton verrucosum HKI 0517]EFE42961.1 MFS transporter, putative [Trichophyton verrucosum HKI 0517]